MNLEIVRKNEEEQRAERLKNQPSDREILLKALTDRGDEVLAAAEASYPREMQTMIPQLALLIKQRKYHDYIWGRAFTVFQILRNAG